MRRETIPVDRKQGDEQTKREKVTNDRRAEIRKSGGAKTSESNQKGGGMPDRGRTPVSRIRSLELKHAAPVNSALGNHIVDFIGAQTKGLIRKRNRTGGGATRPVLEDKSGRAVPRREQMKSQGPLRGKRC